MDDGSGGINWEVEGNKQLLSDVRYFAYFPYVSSFPFSEEEGFFVWEGDAIDFFSGLVSLTDYTDQGTYDKYKSHDLMIANGILTDNVLSFAMQHVRSLVILDLPKTKSTTGEIIDAPDTYFLNFNPCRMDDGKYYYLIDFSDRLVGGYTNADGVNVRWRIDPWLDYGYYHVYTIDGGSATEIELKP